MKYKIFYLEPTPPIPMIATESPGCTLAAWAMAPYAVKTAHPRIADSVYGNDFGKIDTPCAGVTQYSARPPILYMYIGFPTQIKLLVNSKL